MPTTPNNKVTLWVSLSRVAAGGEELVSYVDARPCAACRGAGRVAEDICIACQGGGTVSQWHTRLIEIPVGARDGMVLRVGGRGLPRDGDDPAGDLLVFIGIASDPHFERRGEDLWCSRRISAVEAVLGTERTVPLLDGPVGLRIPPGIQPGAVLRLVGKGLPWLGGGGHGDVYVRVTVWIPDRLGDAQAELYRRLHALERGRDPLTGAVVDVPVATGEVELLGGGVVDSSRLPAEGRRHGLLGRRASSAVGR